MPENLLEVAKLGKTVGLKGALRLHDKSDFPKQFKKGAKFYLQDGTVLEISAFLQSNSTVKFVGFESIELAQNLVNKTLYQTIENTRKNCPLKKGEFFYFDILGLSVCEDGEILGEVSDIMESGSAYLFEVKTASELVNLGLASTFFVPYLDNFVVQISLDERKILTKNAKAILENS
ncbi:ribosome maturation factor RimM [Campylobacter sp. JMF_01 NE2]|uniref:ribosome maturation factor RimM n=1 Tax=unclassified Campylobacter TaxID=2593542 RepID=UPI0022E9DB72|nr:MULTISPECIES: ribosome maturation factor RimM [unclassified Campylobacter]MDA3046037.1 ribosome maturation factor RimM [Campylobacter sp. VBCF_06 NA8]MDA3048264.1 ribosome maturation factor RimM [Campylobacter sp. JMF_08 NE1]MDA3048830.1 ribosome maturation factor RimM [Campylobacter sp. JMF_15 NE4]MDA3050459.1 ribosome maturation factor RimM [Campylobacter sp. JMF_02 ED1]MDA3051966.1 ribosome maturation factor RimM [Campylobacter sp. JMF_03 NE3]